MKEKDLNGTTEREAVRLNIVILRIKFRAIHVQKVSIATRMSRSRPPVAVRTLNVQVTTTPVVVAGQYIRKRIPAGFGRAGGVERKRRVKPCILLLAVCGLSSELFMSKR